MKVLESLRIAVEREKALQVKNARLLNENSASGKVPEDLIEKARVFADEAARGVEICDVLLGKLDEVEEDFS